MRRQVPKQFRNKPVSDQATAMARAGKSIVARKLYAARDMRIIRLAVKGYPWVEIARQLDLSLVYLSLYRKKRNLDKRIAGYLERTKGIESSDDLDGELTAGDRKSMASRALQRIDERAAGVPQVIEQKAIIVDGKEAVEELRFPAKVELRQKDDHFLASLEYAPKRGPETGVPLRIPAAQMKVLRDLAGRGRPPKPKEIDVTPPRAQATG